jgi:hypothetical protein
MDGTMLRKIVWEEMLLADMRANYFAELLRSYQAKDRWLRIACLVASSGAVATALTQLDVTAKLAAPILATATSFWLLISQYGSLGRDAGDLQGSWAALGRDYERLWNNLSNSNSETTYHQIYDRGEALSRAGAKFPNKKKRLSYWLDQAAALATARYA